MHTLSSHVDQILILGILMAIHHKLWRQSRSLSVLKHEFEKFLRPRVVILIGNDIARRIKMKDTEKATASLAEVDSKGFPVSPAQPFDAAPAWAIDDPTVASLAPSADGTTCDVVAIKPGSANLSVSAAIGGVPFAGSSPVLVTAGDAVSIAIQLGAAVPQ